MSNLHFSVTKLCLIGISLALLTVSCTKGYNLSDRTYDETITIGGENFSFPIGNVKPMTIPDLLGREYPISFKDTTILGKDTAEAICEFIECNSIQIIGTVESTFPYGAKVSLSLLDEHRHSLGITSSEQIINSCSDDGAPGISHLDVTINKKEGIESVGAIVFNVTFIADNQTEVVLPYHTYIKADDLIAKIKGGVTFK